MRDTAGGNKASPAHQASHAEMPGSHLPLGEDTCCVSQAPAPGVGRPAGRVPGGNLPVCQAALEHGGEEVQAVDGPVPGWRQACEGQAGGEEVHDVAQLVAHLR